VDETTKRCVKSFSIVLTKIWKLSPYLAAPLAVSCRTWMNQD
jgi:hypothetical protein